MYSALVTEKRGVVDEGILGGGFCICIFYTAEPRRLGLDRRVGDCNVALRPVGSGIVAWTSSCTPMPKRARESSRPQVTPRPSIVMTCGV